MSYPVADANSVPINVKTFGAIGDGLTDDTAAIQAAINSLGVSSTVFNSIATQGNVLYFPPGVYLTTSPLIPSSFIIMQGSGRNSSRLCNNSSDLFAWGTGTLVFRFNLENLGLETGGQGGHVFDFNGDSTGGWARSYVVGCTIRARNINSSLMKWRGGGQYIGVTCERNELDASASRTVPAWDMTTTQGNVINSNSWRNSNCDGHSTTLVPFFRIECTAAGSYHYNNTFENLVGEQNGGGFIHVYGCDGVTVKDCPDWDLVGAYQDHVYKFAPAASNTNVCRNVEIKRSYRLSNPGGLGAGISDIYAVANNPANSTHTSITIDQCDPPGSVAVVTMNGAASIVGQTRNYKVVTANYTVTDLDPDLIVCNSASAITVTLPSAVTAKNGREVEVKNIGAGVVTVSPNVDGAVLTLSQWQKAICLTDGVNAAMGRIWITI